MRERRCLLVFAWISGYLILGIITIILSAYDSFSKSFDFGLSGGWEFFWGQRYLIWLIIIVGCPIFFLKEVHTKCSERKYVKEWRTKGSFTRKI